MVLANKCHPGDNMADAFVSRLKELDLLGSLLTITCNNASNMTGMATAIEGMSNRHPEITFKADQHKISCIGHVLNLAVQTVSQGP